ncbi:MFS transporter [Tsukamurella ocularis]|uniref:MFS transporter n=1 Tax=Tsukamurella ocularis TaxID=1970234 RepID=UPI002168D79D|nr:MFS transporter [Tsukamurella ocularis]MCS3780419.1 MFS family permease [Tsukamurella ocularis]MCS3786026.1 MFS family permease [Tsukamurella ocularis]MCS3849390.1 MFS family permease [Tsukamurella ocularis]
MTRRATKTFSVLWFGQFAATAGLTILVPLTPFYLTDLGVRDGALSAWTGVSVAAPAVTYVLTGPIWGRLGDRYGPKSMVLRAYLGLAIAVAAMALAQTPLQFLLCRLAQGAFGGVAGATTTYAASIADDQQHGRMFGWLSNSTAVGALVGPLVGSVAVNWFGYSALFTATAALLLIACVLSATTLPNTSMTAANLENRWSEGVASAVAVLRRKPLLPLIVAAILADSAVFGLVVVFAPRLSAITGSTASAIMWVGLLQALTWAGAAVIGPWWGRRNDRRDGGESFALASGMCAVAISLQSVAPTPLLMAPLRLVQGCSSAAFDQSVMHTVCRTVPNHIRGTAIGTTTALVGIGQIAGPLIAAVVATTVGITATFLVLALLVGIAAAISLAAGRVASDSAVVSGREPTAHEARQ